MSFIKLLARAATVTSLTYRVLFTSVLIVQLVKTARKK